MKDPKAGEEFMAKVRALPPLTPADHRDLKQQTSRLVQFIAQRFPEFGRLLVHVPYRYTDERAYIGYTNGREITLCRGFYLLSNPEQVGVFIHELMHIVLQHITRCGNRVMAIHNIAADLLINELIDNHNHSAIKLPEFGLFFKNEPFRPALDVKPAGRWTVEALYVWLLENLPRTNEPGKGIPVPSGKLPKGANPNPIKRPDGIMDDLQQGEGEDELDTTDQEKWGRLTRQAMAGAGTDSLLYKLKGLLPESKIPWHRELKHIANRALLDTMESNSFPSRRYLSHAAPYEPSYKPKPGIRLMGLLMDVSGSVFNPEDLEIFTVQMKPLQTRFAADTLIVTVDTQIKNTWRLKPQDDLLKTLREVKGGGGTDLVPGIEYLERMGADVIIVLTDLELSRWPTKLKRPLIWVSNQEGKAPIGKTLVIK